MPSPRDLPTRLQHGDISLHKVDPADVDAIAEGVRSSIEALHRWQPWAIPDYDRHDAMTWACHSWLGWDAGKAYQFVVRRGDDPAILGTVGLNLIQGGQANLGYWTRTSATGQGLATTAAKLTARFGFEHAGLRRLHLHHHVDNHGSRRVAEKVGFVREGLHRQVAMLHDAPIDAVFYSLVSADEVAPL